MIYALGSDSSHITFTLVTPFTGQETEAKKGREALFWARTFTPS